VHKAEMADVIAARIRAILIIQIFLQSLKPLLILSHDREEHIFVLNIVRQSHQRYIWRLDHFESFAPYAQMIEDCYQAKRDVLLQASLSITT
jgi:hypothetical protein